MKKFVDEFGIEYPIEKYFGDVIMGRESTCNIILPPVNSEYRDKNKMPIKYMSVSRIHALFRPTESTITNISQRNKVTVDDIFSLAPRIPFEIDNGSKIKLGDLELKYIDK